MTIAAMAQDGKPGTSPASAVLGYLRVSTSDQADSGAGLAAQRHSIEGEAARRGWEVEWIVDAGQSAKSLDRPGMTDALARLASGEATTLVVSRLDRLSRSMLDFSSLVERARRESWAIVALDLGIDMTSAEGELMANVRASFAAYERRLISIRTREAMAAKKAAGAVFGPPRTISDEVAHLARDLRGSGLTFAEVGAELERAGHVAASGRWLPGTLHKLVKRAELAV